MATGITGVNFSSGYNTWFNLDDSNGGNWVRIGSPTPSIIAIPNTPNPNATSIMHSTACVFNGVIFLYGGYNLTAQTQVNNLYSYNPLSNSWQTLSSSPSAGTNSGGLVTANGKIYAIGGTTGAGGSAASGVTNGVYEYDPGSDTWQTKNNMPDFFNSGYISINNMIYRVGGENASTFAATNALYTYDPITDTWANTLSSHPNSNGIFNLQPLYYGNKIWCCGGLDGSSFGPVNTCFVYDIPSNTWSQIANLPVVLQNYQGVVLNNVMYIISGVTASGSTSNNIYSYRFETGNWIKETLTTPFVLTAGSNISIVAPEPVGLGGA